MADDGVDAVADEVAAGLRCGEGGEVGAEVAAGAGGEPAAAAEEGEADEAGDEGEAAGPGGAAPAGEEEEGDEGELGGDPALLLQPSPNLPRQLGQVIIAPRGDVSGATERLKTVTAELQAQGRRVLARQRKTWAAFVEAVRRVTGGEHV